MAGSNGFNHQLVNEPKSQAEAEKILVGEPQTLGYKPNHPLINLWDRSSSMGWTQTMLHDVEKMRFHPSVTHPYNHYKGAISSVKFTIKTKKSSWGEFLQKFLDRFWARSLEQCQHVYDYGWLGAEPVYETENGVLQYAGLIDFHAWDSWVLTRKQKFRGVAVQGVEGAKGLVGLWAGGKWPAKGFWLTHKKRFSRWYGQSQLQSAWRPWRRLAYPSGAEEVIDGGVYRFAYRGPIMRYPPGSFKNADGSINYDAAREKAREFVENAKAGVSIALPNTRDEKGADYAWTVEFPEHVIEVAPLTGYAEYLEKQIATGIDVPPELLEAAETGSGFSGRVIPLLGFYALQRGNARNFCWEALRQVGLPLARWNFGPEVQAEVDVTVTLPQELAGQQQQQPGAGNDGLSALANGQQQQEEPPEQPEQGQEQGQTPANPLASLFAQPQPGGQTQLATESPAAGVTVAVETPLSLSVVEDVFELGTEADWTPHQSRTGKTAWKNVNTGEVRYQEKKPGTRRKRGEAEKGAASSPAAETVTQALAAGKAAVTAQETAERFKLPQEPTPTAPPALSQAIERLRKDFYTANVLDADGAAFFASILRGVPPGKGAEDVHEHPLYGKLPSATPEMILQVAEKSRQAALQQLPPDRSPQTSAEWQAYQNGHYGAWVQQHGEQAKGPVLTYMSDNYVYVNSLLRDGRSAPSLPNVQEEEARAKETVKQLDAVFASVPATDRELQVYRILGYGFDSNSLLPQNQQEQAGPSQLEVLHQSLSSGKLKVGDTLEDKAYQSTSYMPFGPAGVRANPHGVALKITVPKGAKMLPTDAIAGIGQGEFEVVLPRDAAYRIDGIRQEGGRLVCDVTLVRSGGQTLAESKPKAQAKLPDPPPPTPSLTYRARGVLRKVWGAAKWLEHKVMIGFRKSRELAEEVARQKGYSEQHAVRVGRVLGAVDLALGWTVNPVAAGVATGGNVAAMKAAAWAPVASLLYVAGSGALNPFALWRAAKKVFARKPASGETHLALADTPDLTADLLERFHKAGRHADWYEALFCAALAENGQPQAAMEAADAAFARLPETPLSAGRSVSDLDLEDFTGFADEEEDGRTLSLTDPLEGDLPAPVEDPEITDLLRRVQAGWNTLAASVRRDLLASLREAGDLGLTLDVARHTLERYLPDIVQSLTEVQMAGLLSGMQRVAQRIQDDAAPSQVETPLSSSWVQPEFEPQPVLSLPVINEAVRHLQSRRLLTKPQYDALTGAAKQMAFTVAGLETEAALGKVRDALVEAVEQGHSLEQFDRTVEERLGAGTFLSPAHMETVFRTSVQDAYSKGQEKLLEHPVVDELFPFVEYSAIHDDRVRDDHLALEKHGIGGSNIYYRSDPVWQIIRPPNAWNCRCSWRPVSVREAARRGIPDAVEWQRSGERPFEPSFVPMPPFRPDPEFDRGVTLSTVIELGWIQRGTSPRGMPHWYNSDTKEHRYQKNMPGTGRKRGQQKEEPAPRRQAQGEDYEPVSTESMQNLSGKPAAATQQPAQNEPKEPTQPKPAPLPVKPAKATLPPQDAAKLKALQEDAQKDASNPQHAMQRLKGQLADVQFGNGPKIRTLRSTKDQPLSAQDHAEMSRVHARLGGILKITGNKDLSDAHFAAARFHGDLKARKESAAPAPAASAAPTATPQPRPPLASKVTPKPANKAVPKGGPKYEYANRKQGLDRIRDILGDTADANAVFRAAGGTDGATMYVKKTWQNEDGSRAFEVLINHQDYKAQRVFKRAPDGQVIVGNILFKVYDKGKGLGAKVFASQVEELSRLGVKEIVATAAGSYRDIEQYNGYLTWPKLGYDGDIKDAGDEVARKLPPEYAGVTTVQQLLAKPGGLEWWKLNGRSMPMRFDLREGSQSRKILNEYLAQKAKQKPRETIPTSRPMTS